MGEIGAMGAKRNDVKEDRQQRESMDLDLGFWGDVKGSSRGSQRIWIWGVGVT